MVDVLPVIDVSPLLSGSEVGLKSVAAEIGAVSREIGFFYIANHGVPKRLTDEVFRETIAFFGRSSNDKQKLSFKNSKSNNGYFAIDDEQLASQYSDLKEAFQVNRDIPDDDPDYLAGKPFCAPNQWPADAPRLRVSAVEYFQTQKRLCESLHEAFAVDLGLPRDFFVPYINQPLATLRLLHYPPVEGSFDGRRYGAAPHTDYGNLTTLAQDDAGGLEVRVRDGRWIVAEPIADTFICNIGDCLMRWSNDTYISTEHRVINRSGRDRYSVVFFHDPNFDAPVVCLPSCTSQQRPPRYAPTTGGEYLMSRLQETFKY